MALDLRIPIGLLFALLGLMLTGFGIVSDPSIYAVSLGYNANVWAGALMLLFGAGMLGSAWLGNKKD